MLKTAAKLAVFIWVQLAGSLTTFTYRFLTLKVL